MSIIIECPECELSYNVDQSNPDQSFETRCPRCQTLISHTQANGSTQLEIINEAERRRKKIKRLVLISAAVLWILAPIVVLEFQKRSEIRHEQAMREIRIQKENEQNQQLEAERIHQQKLAVEAEAKAEEIEEKLRLQESLRQRSEDFRRIAEYNAAKGKRLNSTVISFGDAGVIPSSREIIQVIDGDLALIRWSSRQTVFMQFDTTSFVDGQRVIFSGVWLFDDRMTYETVTGAQRTLLLGRELNPY
jgi:predicted Zn finger-like uncharacterized protein